MNFLDAGVRDAELTLVLAPGAGAPADSAWMEEMTARLAGAGLRVLRFDFDYMAERRRTGSRRPPPKAEALVAEYAAAVAAAAPRVHGRLLIGGKSLGGRVASLVADRLFAEGTISGLVCLGYPFHPPKQPEKLRTAHLEELACPALVVQGERDPFGTPDEVAGYRLSPNIKVHWAPDGDHDLAPRRSSGTTLEDNMADAVRKIVEFSRGLGDHTA